MSKQANAKDKFIGKGRELVKPVVHGIARRALPVVERASGTKYVRERGATGTAESPSSAKGAKKIALETARSYRNLASALKGRTAGDIDGWTVAPAKKEVDAKLREIARLNADSILAESLISGSSLGASMVEAGRALVEAGLHGEAVSIGLNLRRRPEHQQIGRVLLGMAYHRASNPEAAWNEFERIDDRELITAAALEYYPTAIDTLGNEALPLIERSNQMGDTEKWNSKAVLRTAESAFCIDAFAHVRTLLDSRLAWGEDKLSEAVKYELMRMREWLPGGVHLQPLPTTPGKRNFGVLSYDQPGIRSRNIGDYIQTLASIGHLLRYENLSFTGDTGLTDLFAKLRNSVKQERKYAGPEAELNLVEVYRDGNVYQDIPEDTWYIAFGWYMHDIFGKSFNIPFHPNLRPILLSVFVRYPEMLTPDAIAYLKKYGPVGCRDWQSVAVLRAVGVPAFFSGCLTTTVDTLFPARDRDKRSGTLRVDWMKGGKGPSRKQTVTAIRDKSFPENLELARSWVSDYAYKYSRVLTSRLHANLPARSVGAAVEFEPKNKSDSRFGGLYGINDAEFDTIRTGILDKLAIIIPLIAEGASEDEIYAKWIEITEDDMAAADKYLAESTLPDVSSAELGSAASATNKPQPESGTTDVYLSVNKGEETLVETAAKSIDENSSSRYRLWLASGALDAERVSEIGATLSNGTLHVLGAVAYPGITAREDLTQALLPVLFADHDRLVVLPAAAEISADVAELSRTNLGSSMLGAKQDVRKTRTSGLTLMRRIASAFQDDHVGALDFVFASHSTLNEDFVVFDPQIAVLDLARLRNEGVPERVVGLLKTVGINYVDSLQVAVGGRYAELDADWNVRAHWETSDSPRIVNWRGQTRHLSHMALPA
ncbi:polysaccharide pyruvyl transferase family protein [Brevibacterium zhoupengii]|uniref:polysaccharide pyruvyl transferase family protein n=1 Tax=Brevibacterium zhoupengii TaxID=2898795 RepID=UPI001E2F6FD2|nr:polysaccharide pyruvyl transferase family protein [Brevibacterium zhoupengii]